MNIVIALSQCDWHDCHTSQYTAGTVKALSLFAADIMTTLLFAVYILHTVSFSSPIQIILTQKYRARQSKVSPYNLLPIIHLRF